MQFEAPVSLGGQHREQVRIDHGIVDFLRKLSFALRACAALGQKGTNLFYRIEESLSFPSAHRQSLPAHARKREPVPVQVVRGEGLSAGRRL
jgi:hypothetical protein